MTKEEIFAQLNQNPVFQVATNDDGQPRVRGVLLYRADENGIIFHTGDWKDLYKQIEKDNRAEFCFSCGACQIRVTGKLEIVEDPTLKDEIVNSPSREFIRGWIKSGQMTDYHTHLKVLRMTHGNATVWTMDQNFAEKTYITL